MGNDTIDASEIPVVAIVQLRLRIAPQLYNAMQ